MKKKILVILLILILIVAIISGTYLVYVGYIMPKETNDIVNEYQELYTENTPPLENNWQEGEVLPKFNSLLDKNKDTIGWLTIPSIKIDMPVFYREKNPEYYLRRTAEGKYSSYGSLFMSSVTSVYPMSQKLIIYGHNMKNGKMFGSLKKFENLNFLKENPVFSFDTLYEDCEWKIIAVCNFSIYTDQTDEFDYRKTCITKESFDDFIYILRTRSYFYINDDVRFGDDILMLSTCDYAFNGERFVIVARRIRNGESSNVETSNYAKNPLVRLPNEYYKNNKFPSDNVLRQNYNNYFLSF